MTPEQGYAGMKAALNTTLTESERERVQRDLERLNAIQFQKDMKQYGAMLAGLPKPQMDLEIEG